MKFNEIITTVDDLLCFVNSVLSAIFFLKAWLGDEKKENTRLLVAIYFTLNEMIFSR